MILHASRRPLPAPTLYRLEKGRPDNITANTLPAHVSRVLRGKAPRPPCECGQPATHLARFVILGPHNSELSGGLFVCAACAAAMAGDAPIKVKEMES